MATWKVDPTHTSVSFSARHMMITTVRGLFQNVTVNRFEFDPANPATAHVDVTIDTSSINTNMDARDGHLKSPDFLDIANYPTLTFKSTKVEPTGGNTARVTGDLTIRNVTHPVTMEAEFIGEGRSPFSGGRVVGFEGTTKINREDWGLVWNVGLEAGGVLVGKEIKIDLALEAEEVVEGAAVPA